MKKALFSLAALASLSALGLTLTACGPSKATLAIQSKAAIGEVQGLQNKLTWLEANAQSNNSYVIELDSDEKIKGFLGEGTDLHLSFKDKDNITITFRGIGANRTISRAENNSAIKESGLGTVISIGSGVTLILDANITIKGYGKPFSTATGGAETGSLVVIQKGGTLIMNEGSAITTNKNFNGNGGGVNVRSNAAFIMKGGVISNMICHQVQNGAWAAATKGKANAMSLKQCQGGGVYVSGKTDAMQGSMLSGIGFLKSDGGTFIKTGGTIFGYSDGSENSNAVKDFNGLNVAHGNGHAIYFDNSVNPAAFDNTVGPEITLEFKDGVLKEGKAEAVAKEAASEQPTAPAAPQSAEQEYQAAAQKIKAKQQEAVQEYQAAAQKNPAAQQEALLKYKKAIQETKQEMQEAARKYQEAMQKL